MKKQYILKIKYEQMLWAIGELHKAVCRCTEQQEVYTIQHSSSF